MLRRLTSPGSPLLPRSSCSPVSRAILGLTLAIGMTVLSGCAKPQNSTQINYQMGERITNGPLVYNVVQTVWKPQIGDLFTARTPENRFLMIMLSATNSGGKEVALPFFPWRERTARSTKRLKMVDGVENWFGLLRTLNPAETRQGNLVFDVPLTSYRLRLTDGGELGTEKNVWVEIPLRLDTDTSVSMPAPEKNRGPLGFAGATLPGVAVVRAGARAALVGSARHRTRGGDQFKTVRF